MAMIFLSIDLGTTNVKVACFDEKLKMLSIASQQVEYDKDGTWVEFDAEQYFLMVMRLIRESCKSAGLKKPYPVAQIVLTGQAESLVLLGSDYRPLRKAISWLDMRSQSECDELRSIFPSERCYPVTGQIEIIPTWPITKMLWLKKNEPQAFSQTVKYLLLKDYIVFRLTGQLAGEYSCYNFSHYFDIFRKQYWTDILDYVGVRKDQLPPLVEPLTLIGSITHQAADELEISDDVMVNVGALDHFCGMVGTGNIEEGLISESAGTVLSVATLVSDPDLSKSMVPIHCGPFPNQYVYLPVCESGGISLEWYKNAFCPEMSFAEMDNAVSRLQDSQSLMFLPYIAGTNAPEYNSLAKGIFYGISAVHTKEDFAYAVMEGVAHLLKKNIDCIAKTTNIKRIVSVGGGAKSAVWSQIKANVTGVPICIPQNEEACCLGAAIMGAVSQGLYESYAAAVQDNIAIATEYTPVQTADWKERHQLFLDLYDAMNPIYEKYSAMAQ